MKRKILLILLISVILVLSGCSKKEVEVDISTNVTESALYENASVGIRVTELSNWYLEKETSSIPINILFGNGKLKSIITIADSSITNEEIKRQLKYGAGNVIVIDEATDYIAFKSQRKESIRTDIYIKKTGKNKVVIVFMTPTDLYEESKENINLFKESIEFF